MRLIIFLHVLIKYTYSDVLTKAHAKYLIIIWTALFDITYKVDIF